jgi:hypothetical protein
MKMFRARAVKEFGRESEIVGFLRELAERGGVTLYRVHQILGRPVTTVYGWDKRPWDMPLGSFNELCEAIGVSWSDGQQLYKDAIKAAEKAAEREKEPKVENKKKRKKE